MNPTGSQQPPSPNEHDADEPQGAASSESTLLFPEPAVPRLGPLGYVEPPVRWFTSSTRPEAVTSRAVVNAWYNRFPDVAGRFAKRLSSTDAALHFGALDELYAHEMLRDRHADVRYEVDAKGPDFRIFELDHCTAAVEVVSVFESEAWTAPQIQYGRIADALNEAVKPSAGYFVNLDLIRARRDPSPPRLAQFVQSQLEQLPPHEELAGRFSPHELRAHLPRSTYREGDDVQIDLTFSPMKPNARSLTNPDARITGIGPLIFGPSTTSQRLKAKVKQKAGGRYDISGIPFAVVVGFHEPFCDQDDLLDAFYGHEVFNARTGTVERGNDGLFGTDSHRPNGRNRRLSAVIVIKALPLWRDPEDNILLLPNPHAEQPWPAGTLPARTLAPRDM